jgi:hypothetical protein
MVSGQIGRIALLWRGDRDARAKATAANTRLSPVFEALTGVNVAAEPAVYSDEIVDEVRDQLVSDASEPAFQALKRKMESEWTPAIMRILDIDRASLPVIWDADFLYGPKSATGEDTYVLCEINVSAVFPFPEHATPKIANAVASRISSLMK